MKIKSIQKEALQQIDNVVVLAKSKKDIDRLPCDKPLPFLKEKFNDEAFQYIKTPKHLMFVINLNKLNGEELRKKAAEVLEMTKDQKNLAVSSNDKEALKNFIEGYYLANYQFLKYFKDKKKKKNKIKELLIDGLSQKEIDELTNVLDATLWARDLVNEPVSFLDSVRLAKEIKQKGEKAGLKVKVLNKKELEKLKMGGLLAVNQGSVTPPTFTIIEWNPKNAKNKKPVVLVGKGVVYDTGGLSLKPTPHSMDSMKSDMGGAAMMAATMEALAKNKVPVHVIALIPSTDNRPGKNAYAPGDVVKMYDGTTVEVLNTDAEGRMILADAIAYADKYKPEVIIDAATLTGAAVRAIGDKAAIIMGNAGKSYIKDIEKAGEKTHERVVEFPFWDEWKEEMKSDIADLKNIGSGNAGMITAGKFLEHFAKQPYIHIDIAGPAFLESKQDYKGKGGTGFGVRLMYEYLKNKK